MTRALLTLFVLGAAGCSSPQIACDREGMIIVPEGVDTETTREWKRRNLDLAMARLDDATGMKPAMREHLVKAAGCP
jgi:hypothetical protein